MPTIGDRSVAGPSDGRHSCRPCSMGASPLKQVLAPTVRNRFPSSPTTYRSCFLRAKHASMPTIGDRSVAGPSDGRHSCRPCCMGASPPKQVLAPTGRNRFPWPPSATGVSPVRRMGDPLVAPAAWEPPHQNKFWHRREETDFHAHHRRQECRRSAGWATLLSPLQRGSLPTKTSFGPDGKKQLSKHTNDLQKLFHGSQPPPQNGLLAVTEKASRILRRNVSRMVFLRNNPGGKRPFCVCLG